MLEIGEILASGAKLNGRRREDCEARWRRFAKLTPCLVSTFHMAPWMFDYFDPRGSDNRPLYNFVDLLIVEEAGQVVPEIGAAMLALARRALMVGDVHQIEPVWNVPAKVDLENLRAEGLDADAAELEAYRSSCGSLMLIAQRATAVSADEGDPGILLTEHRRSVPEVIDYCSELVYQGRLRVFRESLAEADRILPPMGWAHVRARAERRGSSWVNGGEARAIAGWLKKRRAELENFYEGGDIAKIVGVITPFAAQRNVLREALARRELDGVDAGTVHTFQGAERPVIVFSPVYSYGDTAAYFFDRGPNMLNVAVSRAADSFLVIGDMRLFDVTNRAQPSGLLGRYLFKSPERELTGVEAWPDPGVLAEANRLASLEDHRETLARALRESEYRVLVVSPFLSSRALEADEIEKAIKEARGRGVEVCVAYCPSLHRKASFREAADKAAARLRHAGADVRNLDRVHSKTLAVDHAWIVEGSFNWLSAVRDRNHPWQNHEASLLYSGEKASGWIDSAWVEILDRKADRRR